MTEMHASQMNDDVTTRIEVNGVQMGILQSGKPGDVSKHKPVLVLIHGFTGSTQNWSAHMEHFAASGIQVIALDMLGHGLSDAPGNPQRYSMEHCQEDILTALHSLGIGPGEAILLGYSMGGRIALYCGLSGYFRALILESATPGIDDQGEREQRRRSDDAMANCIEQYGIDAFVDYWERRPLFETQNKLPLKTRQALRTQRLKNNVTGLANSLRGVGTGVQPALHNRLSELNLPILLITGSEDTKFHNIAQQMVQHLPQVQHRVVSGAGHTVHLEQPEKFAAIISDFCLSLR